jgi:hypothetical protein
MIFSGENSIKKSWKVVFSIGEIFSSSDKISNSLLKIKKFFWVFNFDFAFCIISFIVIADFNVVFNKVEL